jgi:chromate transport protein ChrA
VIAKFKTNSNIAAAISMLRFAVIGLIAAAVLFLITEESFGKNHTDIASWVIFTITFITVKWLKINPIIVILIFGIFGIFCPLN